MQDRIDELGAELHKVEQTLSAWCMRMAWPGRCPTPPYAAWERRSEIWHELSEMGVTHPKYEHVRWRERKQGVNG